MRRTLATLLLALAAVPIVPAGAAPAAHVVLTGSRSASFETTFPTRFRPDVGIADADADLAVTTRGTFAGVYFERLGGTRLGIGAVVVPAMRGITGDTPAAWGASDTPSFTLPAGRYRVHLLTDGASTVRVRVEGLARDVVATPRTPSRVTGTLHRVGAARVTIPVTVRPTTTTMLVGSTDADYGVANAVSICLDEGRELPCETGNGLGMKTAFLGVGSRASTMTWMTAYPGDVPSGEHTASYTIASAGVPRGLHAFALSVS